MPIERVSRSFKDISMSFQINPLNNDLIVLKNETAIARSIRNLIMTLVGEAPYSDKGSGVSNLLFDNMSATTTEILKNEVESVISRYEPRVSLIEVIADPDYDNNAYNITVSYSIIGIDVLPQQLKVVLETVR
jgi:phage baseplate assembly protein W